MKNKYPWVFTLLLAGFSCVSSTPKVAEEEAFNHAKEQTQLMLEEIDKAKTNSASPVVVPRSLTAAGELQLVPSKDWTSGFFPGVLWYLYEYTGQDKWLGQAKGFTADIEQEKWNAGTHDMGFKIFNSFGNGLRLTGNEDYREVIIQSAKTLLKRYNPEVGALKSWDHSSDQWDFPVIIDNMMNLELLFAATRFTGDSSFYKVAVNHANTTMKNHFRDDYSSYHVIGYNPNNGAVKEKHTHQGFSHKSAWARGQAWGLYGYTMCYRETNDDAYLKLAENIADFVLNHPNMPDDYVPYWDFDAPDIPNEPRDVSAAALIASSLYELSTFSEAGEKYGEAADKTLKSLIEKYTSPKGMNRGFILQNSTGHKPHGSEIDVPIIYADYYYLEALLRKKQLREGKKIAARN